MPTEIKSFLHSSCRHYNHPGGPQPTTVDIAANLVVLRLSLKTSKPPCCSSDSHFIYQIHTGGPHTFPSDVVLYVACYVLCLFVILAVSILGFEDRTLTGSVCPRTLLTFHFLLGYYICYETILILIIFASSNSKDRTLLNLSQMLHTLHYMQHALS